MSKPVFKRSAMNPIGRYVFDNCVTSMFIDNSDSHITMCDITGEISDCITVTLVDVDEESWHCDVNFLDLPILADAIDAGFENQWGV